MSGPSSFSGAALLSDLNDFIGPSQACVLPPVSRLPSEKNTTAAPPAGGNTGMIAIEGQVDAPPTPAPPTAPADDLPLEKKVEITLADCLACSGCVTSAEAVLVNSQSTTEVLRLVETNHRLAQEGKTSEIRPICVTIAPQIAASFAARYQLASPAEARGRLAHAIRRLFGLPADVDPAEATPARIWVFDEREARRVGLAEAAAEFLHRFCAARGGPAALQGCSTVLAASVAGLPARSASGPARRAAAAAPASAGPILASACPGWTCYAEKHARAALYVPMLATTSSATRVAGALARRAVAADATARQAGRPFHVSVQMCYDKKLEAARRSGGLGDEAAPTDGGLDVDCVLTAGELDAAIRAATGPLDGLPSEQLDSLLASLGPSDCPSHPASPSNLASPASATPGSPTPGPDEDLLSDMEEDAGAGGLLEYLLRAAAYELFGLVLPFGAVAHLRRAAPTPGSRASLPLAPFTPGQTARLETRVGRNADTRDFVLLLVADADDPVEREVLTFGTAYGFRNIQNVARRVTRPARPGAGSGWDFVEMMACPGACLNGAGQLRPVDPDKPDMSPEEAALLPPPSPEAARALLRLVAELYGADAGRTPATDSDALQALTARTHAAWLAEMAWVGRAYGALFGQDAIPYGPAARAALHVRYNVIEAPKDSDPVSLASVEW
ncbi:hypothetical protein H696_02966 [Fonticula alba]|uniref:Iron hydrogenase large subunit C-terminal domain-containing protein n=1 Tax=Fonticula alba TaxID=691883 RepID=A0A058Z8I8_FONAL|nr:hypothetical protein H696_02966 [Fonticula alba]KCV70609.1 hypothetical protein H696_02966 [Fonticula alba]|eukprot:XP_009495125.1 hypothetical protein H696_02966 [Fonticula alba]